MLLTKSKVEEIKQAKHQANKELKEVVKENAKKMNEKDDQIAALEAKIQALLKLQSLTGASSGKAGNEGS